MKTIAKFLSKTLLLAFLSFFIIGQSSCKSGEGCELEQKYSVKTDKDGNLSKKRGKSGLWSKKQKKKMKKR